MTRTTKRSKKPKALTDEEPGPKFGTLYDRLILWAASGKPFPRWLAKQLETAFDSYVNGEETNLAALFGIKKKPKPFTDKELEQEIERQSERMAAIRRRFQRRVITPAQWRRLHFVFGVQSEREKNPRKPLSQIFHEALGTSTRVLFNGRWLDIKGPKTYETARRWYYSLVCVKKKVKNEKPLLLARSSIRGYSIVKRRYLWASARNCFAKPSSPKSSDSRLRRCGMTGLKRGVFLT